MHLSFLAIRRVVNPSLLGLLGLLGLAACSGGGDAGSPTNPGDDGGPPPPPPGPTSVALGLSTTTAIPFTAVTVTFPDAVGASGATIGGTFGASNLSLILSDSVTGSFLAPDTAAGSYPIEVPLTGNRVGTATFTLQAAPSVNASAVTTTTQTTLDEISSSFDFDVGIGALDSVGVTQAEVDALDAVLTALSGRLAAASAAELRAAALVIEANSSLFTPLSGASPAAGMPAQTPAIGGVVPDSATIRQQLQELAGIIDVQRDAIREELEVCRIPQGVRQIQDDVLLAGCTARVLDRAVFFQTVIEPLGTTLKPFVLINGLDVVGGTLTERREVPSGVAFALKPVVQLAGLPLRCLPSGFCEGVVASGGEGFAGPLLDQVFDGFAIAVRDINRLRERVGIAPAAISINNDITSASFAESRVLYDIAPGALSGRGECTFNGLQATCENAEASPQNRAIFVDHSYPWRTSFGSQSGDAAVSVLPAAEPTLATVQSIQSIPGRWGNFAAAPGNPFGVICGRTWDVKALAADIDIVDLRFRSVDAAGRVFERELELANGPVRLARDAEITVFRDAEFFFGFEAGEVPNFTTTYTVDYQVVSTGESKQIVEEWECAPENYVLVESSVTKGSAFNTETTELSCFQDIFLRSVGNQSAVATGAFLRSTANDGRVFETNLIFDPNAGSGAVVAVDIPAGRTVKVLERARFFFPFDDLPQPNFFDVEYEIKYTLQDGTQSRIRSEWRCSR